MKQSIKWKTLLITTVSALLTLIFPTGSHGNGVTTLTQRQITTCGAYSAHFAGWGNITRTPTSTHEWPIGVSGYIQNRLASLCSVNDTQPYNNFTTSWVMLANAGPSGGLAQAGTFRRTTDNCMYSFYEYHRTSVLSFGGPDGFRQVRVDLGCLTSSATYAYRVMRVSNGSGGSLFYFYQTYYGDPSLGNIIGNTSWDPSFWERNVPQYSGEVVNTSSNMPGTSSSHALFSEIGIQAYDTASLVYTPCYLGALGPSGTRYHNTAYSCTAFDIWTNPL